MLLRLGGAAHYASRPHVSCLMTATAGLRQAVLQDQTTAAAEAALPAEYLVHWHAVRKMAGVGLHWGVAAALWWQTGAAGVHQRARCCPRKTAVADASCLS